MSEHTSEPWKFSETRVYFPGIQGGFDLRYCPAPRDNARRIVACVNACKGYSTEDLEEFGRFAENTIPLLEQQCAELAEAMRDVIREFDNADDYKVAFNNARAALAKYHDLREQKNEPRRSTVGTKAG